MTLTTWIPKGKLPAHSGESDYRYWMPSTFLKSEYHFEPCEEPDVGLEEPAATLKERVFKESTLWPEGALLGSGGGPDCGSALRRHDPSVDCISVAVL